MNLSTATLALASGLLLIQTKTLNAVRIFKLTALNNAYCIAEGKKLSTTALRETEANPHLTIHFKTQKAT